MPLRYDTFFNPGAIGGGGGGGPGAPWHWLPRRSVGQGQIVPQQQVRLNAKGPSRDMVGAWFFNKAGVYIPNLSPTQPHIGSGRLTDTSAITHKHSAGVGGYLSFTGSGSERVDLGSIAAGDRLNLARENHATVIARVRYVPSAVSTFPRIIDKSNSGSGAAGWTFAFSEGANQFQWYINSASVSVSPGTLSTLLGNKWATIGVRHYPVSAINSRVEFFYALDDLEPVFFGAANFFASYPTTTTDAAIGNWNHSTARNWEGDIAWVCVWDRAISQGEIRQIVKNPSVLWPATN